MFEGLQTMNEPHSAGFEIIGERSLILRDLTTGQQRMIVAQIGRPYWVVPNIQAACPVAIEVLLGRRRDISGIDPLHALKEALKFCESFLSDPPNGHALFWPSGEAYDLYTETQNVPTRKE